MMQQVESAKIKNIIFDFGNVLLNIDEQRSFDKLNELLDAEKCKDLDEIVIHPFERGEFSEEAFFNRLQRRSKKVLNGDLYYEAWNAMLQDFPANRIRFLQELRGRFKIFILSNTNITHLRNVKRRIKIDHNIDDFDSYFDKCYYSHLIHMRKPEKRIYEFVLEDSNIKADETLFIDDKQENLVPAKELGIYTYCHSPSEDISEVFSRIIF
ncbi:MAG: HAD family phosphatase [Saprospiraceae bacterium]|nr:HAD family phosphatase [Saprospiraceae bacterium]